MAVCPNRPAAYEPQKTMTDERSDFDRLVDELETRRDLPEVRNEASESADNIGAALGLVGEQIGKAYKRLRDTLD